MRQSLTSMMLQGPSEERAGTPNSPYSPWAPWGNAKGSFADALRSPAGLLDLDAAPPGAMPIPTKGFSVPSNDPASTVAAAAPEAERMDGAAEVATEPPATFGAAFATGALRNFGGAASREAPATVTSSFFGAGLQGTRVDPPKLTPPVSLLSAELPASQDLLADMDLEPNGQSISMRAMPQDGA